MKKLKAYAPILEQKCPACGGAFTISTASLKKKVQCPHCREVVTLSEPDELNGTPETLAGPGLPAVPDWMARCEMLQARLEALEHQVEALMVTPRTHAPLIPEQRRDFNPLSREQLPPGVSVERREISHPESPASQVTARDVFPRPGQAIEPEIGILVAAGDGAARRLAEKLSETLVRAGWKVRGVTEIAALPEGCRGLTLAAAPSLPLPRVTNTLNALREAGLAMTYQLDPQRGVSETVMIVGAGAA